VSLRPKQLSLFGSSSSLGPSGSRACLVCTGRRAQLVQIIGPTQPNPPGSLGPLTCLGIKPAWSIWVVWHSLSDSSGPLDPSGSSSLPSSYKSSGTTRLSLRACLACLDHRVCLACSGLRAHLAHSLGPPGLFGSSSLPGPFESSGSLDFFGSLGPTDSFGLSTRLARSCL